MIFDLSQLVCRWSTSLPLLPFSYFHPTRSPLPGSVPASNSVTIAGGVCWDVSLGGEPFLGFGEGSEGWRGRGIGVGRIESGGEIGMGGEIWDGRWVVDD